MLRKRTQYCFVCCDNVLPLNNIVYNLGCLVLNKGDGKTFYENVSESACHLLNFLSDITSLNST